MSSRFSIAFDPLARQPERYKGEPDQRDPHARTKREIEKRLEQLALDRELSPLGEKWLSLRLNPRDHK